MKTNETYIKRNIKTVRKEIKKRMSCTNEQLQLCNELHKPENGKAIATMTVVYGPYMN